MAVEWTLAKIRSEVRRLTGRRSTNSLSNADLTDRINQYYTLLLPYEIDVHEFSAIVRFDTMNGLGEYAKGGDSVSTGVYTFGASIPTFGEEVATYTTLTTSDILRIEPGVVCLGGDEVRTSLDLYLEATSFFSDYPGELVDDPLDHNRPTAILLHANTLYLRPVPDAVYTIQFAAKIQRPPELVNDNDILWDHSWGWSVCHGAAIQILQASGEFEEAAALGSMYETLKNAVARKQALRWPATHRAAPRF